MSFVTNYKIVKNALILRNLFWNRKKNFYETKSVVYYVSKLDTVQNSAKLMWYAFYVTKINLFWCALNYQLIKRQENNQIRHAQKSPSLLSHCVPEDLFLQTLMVTLKSKGKERQARVLIDNSFQQLYILESTAENLSMDPTEKRVS